jgi:hypothetical protein
MLQRLFIHANVEAEMHKRDSIIGHHDFTNPSNMDDNNNKNKHSGLKVIIIAATLYFIWIWVGIIFYKYHSNWTLGMYTCMCITMKPPPQNDLGL